MNKLVPNNNIKENPSRSKIFFLDIIEKSKIKKQRKNSGIGYKFFNPVVENLIVNKFKVLLDFKKNRQYHLPV